MRKLTFLIMMIGIVISCANSESKEEYITNQVEKLTADLEICYEKVIILPGSGCAGCITTAEDFFKNNVNNKKYLFILTRVQSIKMLNQKTGLEVLSLSNVYLDESNVFSNYEKSIYPVVVSNDCETKQVTKLVFQNPETDAFSDI